MPLPAFFLVGGVGYILYREHNKERLKERIEKAINDYQNWSQQLRSEQPDKTRNPVGASVSPSNRASSTDTRASSSRLEIQNKDGETLFSIAELANLPPRRWETMHESGTSLFSKLNPLLSAVPAAAITGDVASTKYMVVEIAGGLTKAADGDGWRAVSMGSKGVKEHARLFSPDRLQSIVGIGVLWQIASIVVAQKHLHDINENLRDINRKIDAIHEHQKNERMSKVLGCREYFEQMFADITVGNMSNSLQTVVEDRCVELMQIEKHFRLDIEQKISGMEESEVGEGFNKTLQNWADDIRGLFVCIETRLLGYQFMAIGGEDRDALDNRLDRIRRHIECLQDDSICFVRSIVCKLNKEASFWSSISRVEESLVALEELQLREELGNSFNNIHEEVGIAQNIIEQRSGPQEILLKVNGGKIDGFAVAEAVERS